jgi:hypothetical protein
MSSRGEDPALQRRNRPSKENNDPFVSPEGENPVEDFIPKSNDSNNKLWNQFQTMIPGSDNYRMPPIQVDDTNLLYYDVFLLVNLVVSISFWVVHRMQLEYMTPAFNEGCLLSILWITAGLYHGAFLNSAIDGHYFQPQQKYSSKSLESEQNGNKKHWWDFQHQGGPPGAGLLAINTFLNTISLRLILAFVVAVIQHRQVGADPMEQLIPFEVGFGLILMSAWRSIHSAITPRL